MVEELDEPKSGNIRGIFDEARGTMDEVNFDQAIRLEGVDGIIDEGATTLQELEVLWGDTAEAKNFDEFSLWYGDILNLYDDFLWKDAVAPPDAIFGDEETSKDEDKEWTDEDLLEDAPVIATGLDEVARKMDAEKEAGKIISVAAGPAPETAGRSTEEIKSLFQEVSGDDNLVSVEEFKELDEIKDLLQSGDLQEAELQDMWSELPGASAAGGRVDIFAFRAMLNRIDDLYEADEEATAMTPAMCALTREELKQAIQEAVNSLKLPVGLDGREDLDQSVLRAAAKLEQNWRLLNQASFENFDTDLLLGDWELSFTTSDKMRRYKSVLNQDEGLIRGVDFVTVIQSFRKSKDVLGILEYDVEEVFKTRGNNSMELSVRGAGVWRAATIPNVVTGSEDLKLQMNILQLEHDTENGKLIDPGVSCLKGQMARTWCYCFVSYVDSEMLVLRTGFQPNQFFIFSKMLDNEDEDA